MVLSENLDENAIQILLDLHLAHAFPEQSNEWQSVKQDISDMFTRERVKRERARLEEFASEKNALRCVLRDAVVQNVMARFPCVLFINSPTPECGSGLDSRSLERDRLSSRVPSHTNPSVEQEIASRLSLYATFHLAHCVHQTRFASQISTPNFQIHFESCSKMLDSTSH